MINRCVKNQGNRGGSCISGVSVLQKVTLNDSVIPKLYLNSLAYIREDVIFLRFYGYLGF